MLINNGEDMNELLDRINKDINKIKVIDCFDENVLFESDYICLKRGSYKLSDGKIISRECIYNKIGVGRAVCVFAVTEDKKILLVIQPRVVLKDNNGINIEVPAGYVEEGEDVILAGMRELQEETGYTSSEVYKLDSYHTSIGFSDEVIDLLLAVNCKKVSEQTLDDDEDIIVEEVTLDEFDYLLNNNFIMDINTKMGYYRYLYYLQRGGI